MKHLARLIIMLWCAASLAVLPGGLLAEPDRGDGLTIRDAQNRIVLVPRVTSEAVWKQIAGVIKENELKGTRFLIPVPGKSRLYPYFMNLNNVPDHHIVLMEYFSDQFADITYNSYVTKAIDPARRVFYSGNITERKDRNGRRIFTYTIWHHVSDPAKALRPAELEKVHATLQSLFTLGELRYDPFSKNQRDVMRAWKRAPVPVYFQDELLNGYEPYTLARAYGFVRFRRLKGLPNGIVSSDVDYRDILVMDAAPFDVVPPVSGIVTGTRQGELSHLNVRFANRAVANCHIEDPFTALHRWEGKLVRLTVGKDDWEMAAAEEGEARRFWNSLKPAPVAIDAADRKYREILGLQELPTGTTAERMAAVRRYGAKAAHLAALYRLIDDKYELSGLAIPAAWYFDFMKKNGWIVMAGGRNAYRSFEDTIAAWLGEERFQNDAAYRADRLALLRQAMGKGEVDPALLSGLRNEVRRVFGSETVMLRLRSSSNAEDSIFFSGAGLYESKTACIADDFDGDTAGPSRGDRLEKKEKTAAKALKNVWASLWNAQAFEERFWYGIDTRAVGMAVLVNERSKDEKANFVVFTGHPGTDDNRYLFNIQAGDVDTVRAFGGTYPEKAFVRVVNGAADSIERVSFSNIAKYDLYLLSKQQIDEITAVLWKAVRDFPTDFRVPSGRTLLWDSEWKITKDDRIVIKQIRPFLRDDAALKGLR